MSTRTINGLISLFVFSFLMCTGANATKLSAQSDSTLRKKFENLCAAYPNKPYWIWTSLTKGEKKQLKAMRPTNFPLLHYYAVNGNINVMSALLDSRYPVDLRDFKSGKTALMLAAEVGQTESVRFLLDNRANTFFIDKNGCSALDIAILGWVNLEIIELLAERSGFIERSLNLAIERKYSEAVALLQAVADKTVSLY